MRPTLGVLITYFGERDLLTECLRSLAAGSDTPDEILIHDDASAAPATDYVPPGVRATVIRSPINQGPAAGRNRLLAAASSEYIHFHDADDLFAPAWCARVRQTIAQTASDAIFTEIASEYGGHLHASQILGLSRLRRDPDLLRFCLRGSMLVPAGTYRRTLVGAIGGYDTRFWQAEDFEFHARLAATGVSYSVIDEPLVTTRLRPDSRSQRQREVWSCALDAIASLAHTLPPTYRDELADAAVRTGSTLFRLGDLQQSRRAFALAADLGNAGYRAFPPLYRWLAIQFGPEIAERLSSGYRHLLPTRVRRRLRRLVPARATP